MVLVLVMMVVVYIGSLLGDKECGARWCGISSFPPEPPGRHINCLYLTATIPHVTSDHLKPLKKCCFLQSSLLLELHLSSVSCQPPLLSSLTINYGVFPLDSVRLSAVFPDEGKTPPCPPHDLPGPGRQCSSWQNSCCSAEDRASTIMFLLFSQAACSLVMWVGGL